MPTIHAEQAVYGSFPFWSKGYGLLAKSTGCREEWIRDFEMICQGFGEPISGASGDGALLCKRLRRGPWLIVRVASQGADDRGRPGALAFHALFVPPAEFAKVAFDPFLLENAFRSDWTESTVLDALTIRAVEPDERSQDWPLAADLLGRGVVIESAVPIDDIAKATWRALKLRDRRVNSLATLTFRDPLRFSLVAVPRISEQVRASGAHILSPDEALQDARQYHPDAQIPSYKPVERIESDFIPRRRLLQFVAAVGLFLISAVGVLGWRLGSRGETTPPPAKVVEAPTPDPGDDRPVEPDERSRLVEGLIELGERFHLDMPNSLDPTSLMREIDRQLRYRGGWLDPKDRERVEREFPEDRGTILAWDRQMQSFRSDRALPRDFERRPLREQVTLFAWSFRLPPDPKRTLGEVPHALIDAMSMDRPVRPSSARSKIPALEGYERFLSRLPRR